MSDRSTVMPCPACGSSGSLNLEMSRVECFNRCGASLAVTLPMSIPDAIDAWNAWVLMQGDATHLEAEASADLTNEWKHLPDE